MLHSFFAQSKRQIAKVSLQINQRYFFQKSNQGYRGILVDFFFDLNPYLMQQFKALEGSALKDKRNHIMRDIRNTERSNIKQRARSQIVEHISKEELNIIIQNTESTIDVAHLKKLVRYANQGYEKAVAHLGNLVLDGVVSVTHLDQYDLKPGFHKYWLWFIEVLIEKQYCTLSLFEHTIKTISPVNSEEAVKSALSILYRMVVSGMQVSLLKDEKAVINLLNAALRNDSASTVAYLLLEQLVTKSNDEVRDIFQNSQMKNRLLNCLRNGLLKINSGIRRACYSSMQELIKKGVILHQLHPFIIKIMRGSCDATQKQAIIDYLHEFTLNSRIQDQMTLIDEGLLVYLGNWKQQLGNQQPEVLRKLILLGRNIDEKSKQVEMIAKGIHRELERYELLSLTSRLEIE